MTIGEGSAAGPGIGSLNDDGGGSFVLDYGPACPGSAMLARRMIRGGRLYRARRWTQFPTAISRSAVTGLRPGEKNCTRNWCGGVGEIDAHRASEDFLQTSENRPVPKWRAAAAIKALRQALEEGDPRPRVPGDRPVSVTDISRRASGAA